MGQFFFLAAPKFYPRQKDPKRVLSAGAWGLVPKSAVWGPPNPEIRNLRPPKFGKKNFFRTCNIFLPKGHPKRSLTHPHRPPSDQNCPKARGARKVPMWTCHVFSSSIRLFCLMVRYSCGTVMRRLGHARGNCGYIQAAGETTSRTLVRQRSQTRVGGSDQQQ